DRCRQHHGFGINQSRDLAPRSFRYSTGRERCSHTESVSRAVSLRAESRLPHPNMPHTPNRPLPRRRVSPREALYFGMGVSGAGTLYLAANINTLTSVIGVIALVSYLFVYTPLKQRTHLCTLIGAFPGAAPVLMGWSAV